jgi:hypothetical protein
VPDGGTPDGGAADGGHPDGGATDGGAPDGGSACGDLVPTPGDAVELTLGTGTHAVCSHATSNPGGQLNLGIRGGEAASEVSFTVYAANGAQIGTPMTGLSAISAWDIDPWFHSTASGYQGIVNDQPPPMLRTWGADGATRSELRQQAAVTSAPDGQGGTVLIAHTFDPNATPSVGPALLESVDASGAVTRSVTLDDSPGLVLVSRDTGDVLAIVTGQGTSRARWFDGAGRALTPWFEVGATLDASRCSLHQLVDGTVALSDGQTWRFLFRDGVASADPVPGWLAARPGTRLATIRQARGYAVLPPPQDTGGNPDETTFEVVTATGESCGSVNLPAPPTPSGVAKVPTRLDVGQDGTLIQTEVLEGQSLGSGVHCGFRWWPALLR